MSDKSKTPPILDVVAGAKKSKTVAKQATKATGNGGGRSNTPQKFGEYMIKNGSFYQFRAVKAGPEGSGVVEFPLCDFACKIIEEVSLFQNLLGGRVSKMVDSLSPSNCRPEQLLGELRAFKP